MISSSGMKYRPTPRQLKGKRKAYDCLRCGYHWTPYAGKRPRRCGRCQSPYWDIPRTKGLPKPSEGPEEPEGKEDEG
jgi:hypothetical protein